MPCHRVVGADGTLTGYAGGPEMKQRLLAHEAKVHGNPMLATARQRSVTT